MPALDHLAGLFYSDLAELGTFEEVLAEDSAASRIARCWPITST